ncbi:transporter [Thioclava sp. SK-1]|uniref:TolC family outer membrane protein n=1 Tax=Thioclava sp. SK-1 TaxID=1889770 RepID=UPI00082536F8|nr:TolC family outer membrane protein [Thioclava sp. SK-1]OCX64196.1 transporter [Thioclava sp. SK-1]
MASRIFKTMVASAVTCAALMGTTGIVAAETLADALISAYRSSNLLDQNRATVRAADEDVASAVASLRPVFQFSAGYNWVENDGSAISRGAEAGISASMTLLDFGRNRIAIDIQKETVLAARESLRAVEQTILLAAIQAYSDVKSAQQQVSINQNSTRVLNEELNATRDRFDVGEVTRTDVSLAESQLAAARASLVAAQGALSTAREDYKAATGHYPVNLAALPPAPSLPKSPDAARSTAQRNHPTIKQLQHVVSVSELGIKAAKAAKRPELVGSVGLDNNEGGILGRSAALSMTQTIYSGGALDSAYRQAVANRDESRSSLLQASVEVAQAVAEAYSAIGVYRAQISAYAEQIRAAEIAYRGVREEATLGARTTLDVLDAEQDLLDARAARIDTEADLQVAYYQLLSAMGLLTVDNLKLGIPTYDPAAYYNAVQNAPLTSIQGKSLDRVLKAIGNN